MNDIHSLHVLLYMPEPQKQRDLIRIHALDQRISDVMLTRALDEHALRPKQDLEEHQVYMRNTLVVNLCQNEIRDMITKEADATRNFVLVSYLLTCVTVCLMSVAFMKKQYAFFGVSWVASISMVTIALLKAKRFDLKMIDKARQLESKYLNIFYKTHRILQVDDKCCICFEDFVPGEYRGHMAGGKTAHLFHTKCLEDTIVKTKRKVSFLFTDCPLCRDPIIAGSYVMLPKR